ncbi:Crp/Fnr family transcriptional regulator [Photobacterium sp. 2_MG-2023]|uniref:Crp/Fnr family transcriptional regulator n=1 Tax=Photobacterium sp. 2_MG-2023 TaxID=3062663 RepID=UPI0026E13631|nr:Crp/Fnr family transcriptional regulator [Photobacterium sp. 2_MG-2023]MDO6582962.1 Crp/Fnr family transcriptional regulator [Photobacterium sp. 2_MG-2023]
MTHCDQTALLHEKLSLLVQIDRENWQQFVNHGRLTHYRAGESIFMPGESTSEIRFICEGLACHYYIKPDGTRRNKSFLQIAEVASSLSSMHSGQPARFGCEALQATLCLSLPYADFQQLCAALPVWQSVSQALLTRLALKKETREADLLLMSPTELYLQFCEQYPVLNQTLPNYHIASYLGISEVSLSRIRARLGVQNTYQRQKSHRH